MNELHRVSIALNPRVQLHRDAWEIINALPFRQRTDGICKMICGYRTQETILEEIKQMISDLRIQPPTEPQSVTGDIDSDVLGFLLSLQKEGENS